MSGQADEVTATPAEVTDRAGRTWRIENYQSPSGPAFSLTLPPELDPQWATGFTAHFDGHLNYLPQGGGL